MKANWILGWMYICEECEHRLDVELSLGRDNWHYGHVCGAHPTPLFYNHETFKLEPGGDAARYHEFEFCNDHNEDGECTLFEEKT